MGEIHIRIRVSSALPIVWLCGPVKESLQHVKIYLDQNVPDEENLKDNYSPRAGRIEISNTKMVGNECKELFGLPPGHHVLSISTHEEKPDHKTTLTHVVMWNQNFSN